MIQIAIVSSAVSSNSRLKEVSVEINGERIGSFPVEDTAGWVFMDIDPVNVESVRLVVEDVYPGSKW